MTKMTKAKIIQILNGIVKNTYVKNLSQNLLDVFVKIEESNETSIVFYNLMDNDVSNKSLVARLENKTIGLLVLNHEPQNIIESDYIVVNDFLEAQKKILDIFYPTRADVKLVGITGTNGKTTVASLSAQLSSFLNHKSITVGTLGVCDEKGGKILDTGLTTPSYVEIRKILAKLEPNIEAVFFEVSSHALMQDRFYKMKFDCGAWTSFSQDHLDYHKNMENYFNAKLKLPLFKLKESAAFYVPKNELTLNSMLDKSNVEYIKAPTLIERNTQVSDEFFRVHFNKSNLEIALSLCEFLWEKIPSEKHIMKLIPPKGRFSPIEFDDKLILIDYAHTPDALSNVCRAVKMTYPGKSVKIVFGCGGNRDKKKRPLMAEAVGPYVNCAYVTSDNPRDEVPEDIIKDILTGLTTNYVSHVDRKMMIERAIVELKAEEILIIAGKGHEDYQEVKGVRNYFSDFDIVYNKIQEIKLSHKNV